MLPKTKTERHSDICKEINALYAMKIMTMVTAFTRPSRKKEWQCPGSDLGISWPGSRA